MLAIVDKKIPDEAKVSLQEHAEVIELSTTRITFDYLSGHPDIFLSVSENDIVYAPSTPGYVIKRLSKTGYNLIRGNTLIRDKYPACAAYNAVITNKLFIHNTSISDNEILSRNENKERINVKQGLCRCSLLPLPDGSFITSDAGIHKKLSPKKHGSLLVKPNDILLPGMKYGFFGGTCGIVDHKCFFIGSLKHFSEGNKVKSYLEEREIEIVELYNGPLFDGGSIIFLK